jgi:hypothetical protein
MKISSERNPLPGRYTEYRNPSKDEYAKMMETLVQEEGLKDDRSIVSSRVVEEE